MTYLIPTFSIIGGSGSIRLVIIIIYHVFFVIELFFCIQTDEQASGIALHLHHNCS